MMQSQLRRLAWRISVRYLARWVHYRGVIVVAMMALMMVLSPIGCGDDEVDTFPTLTNCPIEGEQVLAVGKSVTITISASRGTITGVTTSQEKMLADVVVANVGDGTFTAVVTPTDLGMVEILFFANWNNLDEIVLVELICVFEAVEDLGACCEANSCEVVAENECFFRDGIFGGTGTTCDLNPCIGACCDATGCTEEFSQEQCLENGGIYKGDLSCDDGICQIAGACCIGDGTCSMSDEFDCGSIGGDLGSTFMGDGTACDNVICTTSVGACCIEDGGCVEVTQDACAARSPEFASTFQGVGRSCNDGNGGMLCDGVQAGACCFSGACQVIAKTQCDLIEGTYLGDHFLCSTPEVALMCDSNP